jgi:hypothetical protein
MELSGTTSQAVPADTEAVTVVVHPPGRLVVVQSGQIVFRRRVPAPPGVHALKKIEIPIKKIRRDATAPLHIAWLDPTAPLGKHTISMDDPPSGGDDDGSGSGSGSGSDGDCTRHRDDCDLCIICMPCCPPSVDGPGGGLGSGPHSGSGPGTNAPVTH